MNYKRGDLVIVPFPFVKNSGEQKQKARPAMIISNHNIDRRYSDKILAGITSRVPEQLKETELILESNERTGLAKQSVLRLDYLMTLPVSIISKKIGKVNSKNLKAIDERLSLSLGISEK